MRTSASTSARTARRTDVRGGLRPATPGRATTVCGAEPAGRVTGGMAAEPLMTRLR